jgi:hypothetical protein
MWIEDYQTSATYCSAVHEGTNIDIYEQDIALILPLIAMDQGRYFKNPHP